MLALVQLEFTILPSTSWFRLLVIPLSKEKAAKKGVRILMKKKNYFQASPAMVDLC